jgi:hypothetical protein
MDQADRLREAAKLQLAAGRPAHAIELQAAADEIDRLSSEDSRFASVLVEAARKKKRAAPSGKPRKEEAATFMPGALPLGARKKVPAEVAGIYDSAGATIIHNVLSRLRGTFAEEFGKAKEQVKAAIAQQYGADGVSRYFPLHGEWAEAILANLFEHGHDEMRRDHGADNGVL